MIPFIELIIIPTNKFDAVILLEPLLKIHMNASHTCARQLLNSHRNLVSTFGLQSLWKFRITKTSFSTIEMRNSVKAFIHFEVPLYVTKLSSNAHFFISNNFML